MLGDPASEHEERVAQAVDVLQVPLVDRLLAREPEHLTLEAAAHGARLVHERVDAAAAGQREGLQRLQVFLAVVHQLFEPLHLRLGEVEHAFVLGTGRRRELAAEIEELVLDLLQHVVEPAVVLAVGEALLVERADDADDGVQLVHRPVRFDAR